MPILESTTDHKASYCSKTLQYSADVSYFMKC